MTLSTALACALAADLAPKAPLRPGYAVVAQGVVAQDAVKQSVKLPEALQAMWPDRFTSASAAKKAVRRKLVLVDELAAGVPSCADHVKPGQRLRIVARVEPGPAPGEGRRGVDKEGALPCAFQDDDLAVVIKPSGLTVQRGVRTRLALGLQPTRHRDERSQPLWRPQHVHRLDAPTSGLLIVAKTGLALRALSAAFAAREVRKRYRAILAGDLAKLHGERGTMRQPLSGQTAHTDWVVVSLHPSQRHGMVTLVDLWPLTGRTHQLRRHAALLGHPIVGDARYGDDTSECDAPEGLLLAAVELELSHPRTGEPLRVCAEQPDRFEGFCRRTGARGGAEEASGDPERAEEL